jgi:methionyl-tRNA formyltransferase
MTKRLVIVTRDDIPHRYVANSLCDAVDVCAILVDRKANSGVKRAFRRGPIHFTSKLARAVFLKAIRDRARGDRLLRHMLGQKAERFLASRKVVDVQGVNSTETIKLLRDLNPDSIVVYGTSMVSEETLSTAKGTCFNLHTGLSPYYRGTACAFWPVVNGEFDMLGATVHECTAKLDGGPIYETVRVSCQNNDNLHKIFGRTVIAGADAYARVLRKYVCGGLQGTLQDLSVGREYRGAELTLWPEIVARIRLAFRRP